MFIDISENRPGGEVDYDADLKDIGGWQSLPRKKAFSESAIHERNKKRQHFL